MMNNFDVKASLFLNQLYYDLGAKKITSAPQRKFDDWDKIVEFENITYKIEEKARTGIWEDLLIEIVEDLKTGDLGWFYQTKADKIVYAFYEDEKQEKPHSVYALSVEKMKNYFFENSKNLIRKSNISPRGYGLTLNIFLPLNLAIKIYPKAEDELTDKA